MKTHDEPIPFTREVIVITWWNVFFFSRQYMPTSQFPASHSVSHTYWKVCSQHTHINSHLRTATHNQLIWEMLWKDTNNKCMLPQSRQSSHSAGHRLETCALLLSNWHNTLTLSSKDKTSAATVSLKCGFTDWQYIFDQILQTLT